MVKEEERQGEWVIIEETLALPSRSDEDTDKEQVYAGAPVQYMESPVFCVLDVVNDQEISRNYNAYTEKAMRDGIHSILYPQPVSILEEHSDEKKMGRAVDACVVKEGDTCRMKILAYVSDPEGARKVQDGRYQAVSIRFRSRDVTCSICGKPVFQCPHVKGEYYEESEGDRKLCFWNINSKMEIGEISFVAVPGVRRARVVSVSDRLTRMWWGPDCDVLETPSPEKADQLFSVPKKEKGETSPPKEGEKEQTEVTVSEGVSKMAEKRPTPETEEKEKECQPCEQEAQKVTIIVVGGTEARLTYQQRKALPDRAFLLVFNIKLKTKTKKVRMFPVHDCPRIRNAIVRLSQMIQGAIGNQYNIPERTLRRLLARARCER